MLQYLFHEHPQRYAHLFNVKPIHSLRRAYFHFPYTVTFHSTFDISHTLVCTCPCPLLRATPFLQLPAYTVNVSLCVSYECTNAAPHLTCSTFHRLQINRKRPLRPYADITYVLKAALRDPTTKKRAYTFLQLFTTTFLRSQLFPSDLCPSDSFPAHVQ